jgi:F-type H+-transporting ATPase subunit gamma
MSDKALTSTRQNPLYPERADKNIDELLESPDGSFHRLRQSGIDEELFDVISGFEALVVP